MPPNINVDTSRSHSPKENGRQQVGLDNMVAGNNEDDTIMTDETTQATNNYTNTTDEMSPPCRARSHWNFVKSLHAKQKTSDKLLFKTGQNSSLTTAEATFLNMITKSRLDGDHDSIVKGSIAGGPNTNNNGASVVANVDTDSDQAANNTDVGNEVLSVSGRTHFTHLVQAAVAKERLRDAISARLSSLSGAESKFLTKLINNKNVTLEALENAVHVLDNDPMYNPSLRKDDDDDDVEEENEEGNDDTKKDDNEENNCDRLCKIRRRSSAVQSSEFFDKIMHQHQNQGGDGVQGLDTLSEDDALPVVANETTDIEAKPVAPVRRLARKSSVAERSVWQLATTAVESEDMEGEENDNSNKEESSINGGMKQQQMDQAGRNFRSPSAHEKRVFNLVHGKSLKMVNSDVLEALAKIEDDDGLPVKSTKVGEAMDPLLMAVPVESTPVVAPRKSKTRRDEEEVKEKSGLDLLESSQQDPPPLPQVEKPADEASLSSFINADGQGVEVGPSLISCCGMDSILDDIMKGNAEEMNVIQDDTVPLVEEDSLTSKKRFLQLNNIKAENERHIRLTTWMGDPNDYPILGLTKKKQTKSRSIAAPDEVEEDNNAGIADKDLRDSLEPHVLSPLLMKCLRDHLPYALREENFWLKYSLARDGASLETIFSTLRHSHHTLLAIETTHGRVFGSFTSSPWRPNGNSYYGSCEAFVWNLRKSREEDCNSLDEYILRESSLVTYQWSHDGNRNVQLSNTKKLFVGGGNPEAEEENKEDDTAIQWGMALALDKDLLKGTSSRCATFASTPLIDNADESEVFEIMNIEIWVSCWQLSDLLQVFFTSNLLYLFTIGAYCMYCFATGSYSMHDRRDGGGTGTWKDVRHGTFQTRVTYWRRC